MSGVQITDTTLRDGHQSLWATRMRIEDMLPVVEKMDQVGYHSLEVWGGATFDVCLRYLGEDPWERLRILKSRIKNTPLQMLLRGQSLVGYQHYPDDVVEAFVHKTVENGIDIMRVFDALNDIRNMETSIRAAQKAGAHVQAAVVYTVSPVHTIQHYLDTAARLAEMGADSICVKDMAGLLTPYRAFELIKKLKENLGLPIQLHSHYVGGLAVATYIKAVEAGVDVIDAAAVPLAFGSSQPPVETVVRALQETPYDTKLDLGLIFEIADYFEQLRKEKGQPRGMTRINDMKVFEHQVPGGMISNLVTQLEEQRSLHLLPKVLEEIPRVREELGYPPLVTPTSQIVGTQAVLNVLAGQRYKMVPGEVKAYLQGFYGQPPAPLNREIADGILGDKEFITCRPADLLKPCMEKMSNEIGELARCPEDILSYALFPQITKKFLENIKSGTSNVAEPETKAQPGKQRVGETRGEDMDMNFGQIKELVHLIDQTDISEFKLKNHDLKIAIKKAGVVESENGTAESAADLDIPATTKDAKKATPAPTPALVDEPSGGFVVQSPMVGTFYRAPAPEAESFVEIGSRVEKGQTLCIIEAMKLMNELEAEVSGTVTEILVDNAQPVDYGQPLLVITED